MRVLLISIGSKGDIIPFVSLAENLNDKGHTVSCMFPEQFGYLIKSQRILFKPLDKEFLELLQSEDGKNAMEGSAPFLRRMKLFYKLYKKNEEISHRMNKKQQEFIDNFKPEIIFHSLKAIIPILWGISSESKTVLVSPVPAVLHPMEGISSITTRGVDLGEVLNSTTNRIMIHFMAARILKYRGLSPFYRSITLTQVKSYLRKSPTLFTTSRYLTPVLKEENSSVKIIGFPTTTSDPALEYDVALSNFIAERKNLVFLTFGSMTNANSERVTNLFISTFEKLGIYAVINVAEGGLKKPVTYDENRFYFTNEVSYKDLFPKIKAVIHHGGSGTTHVGILNGCPTLIIPHIADQYLWNEILSKAKLGPKGKPIHSLSSEWLEKAIRDLIENEEYAKNAQKMATMMQNETFNNEAIEKLMN